MYEKATVEQVVLELIILSEVPARATLDSFAALSKIAKSPPPGACRKVSLLSHRTVPNEAGNHRAARTPPWQRAVR